MDWGHDEPSRDGTDTEKLVVKSSGQNNTQIITH
jgi:hypothetical protein